MPVPEITPYTPSLYLPGSYGKFRSYPRVARAVIPGTGYDVGQLVWGEQRFNIDGSNDPQNFGNYSRVALRGLGQAPIYNTREANRAMGYTKAKMNAYWNARAQACRGMADEGSCLARVARHRPVTITMAGLGLGASGIYDTRQANRAMGWTAKKMNAYWNARAQACRGMADEGSCLARVARHRPVTITMAGLGLSPRAALAQHRSMAYSPEETEAYLRSHGRVGYVTHQGGGYFIPEGEGFQWGQGLGQSQGQVTSAVDLIAQIAANPDATLRAQGPKLVTALDTYVVGPLLDKAAQRTAPYLLKYVVPIFAGLYVLSGIAAYLSYLDLKQATGKADLKLNARRRARRRR